MKLIYIAGKYRAKSDEEKYQNIQRAREVARTFWLTGWAVICPHMNTAFMDGPGTEEVFLEGDREILRRCDAIAMLKGWEESEGARKELELAKSLNLEIIYEK